MKENMIDTWLDKHGDPEIEKFVEKNLAMAEKVNAILKERGISKAEFAEDLGKKPSEVSKWLSGMHNLTFKSIIKMETKLGVDLINIESVTEYKYVYLGSVKGMCLEDKISDFKDDNYEDTQYSSAI